MSLNSEIKVSHHFSHHFAHMPDPNFPAHHRALQSLTRAASPTRAHFPHMSDRILPTCHMTHDPHVSEPISPYT